jgi:hypothetical protein
MSSARERYGEAFWRAHHEAWLRSEFNQREYCEGRRRKFSEADKQQILQEGDAGGCTLLRGSSSLWDSGTHSVPVEAGTDAGGNAVRGGGYRGYDPRRPRSTRHDAASSGREGSPGLRVY